MDGKRFISRDDLFFRGDEPAPLAIIVADLKQSLRKFGVSIPLKVARRGTEYRVVDGLKRLFAINIMNDDMYQDTFPKGVPCEVVEMTDDEIAAYRESLSDAQVA